MANKHHLLAYLNNSNESEIKIFITSKTIIKTIIIGIDLNRLNGHGGQFRKIVPKIVPKIVLKLPKILEIFKIFKKTGVKWEIEYFDYLLELKNTPRRISIINLLLRLEILNKDNFKLETALSLLLLECKQKKSYHNFKYFKKIFTDDEIAMLTTAVRLSVRNNDFHTKDLKDNIETEEMLGFVETHKKMLNITDVGIKQYSRNWNL
jgi:hypothetical protein